MAQTVARSAFFRRPAHARRAAPPLAMSLRRLHGWLGAFFAPAFLFFAASGLLQVFDLHKAQPSRGYAPPAVVRVMGTLHKDQTVRARAETAPHKATGKKGSAPPPTPEPMGLGQELLKAYAAATSVALALTSLVGLYFALSSRRDRAIAAGLLGLGVVAPLVLTLIS